MPLTCDLVIPARNEQANIGPLFDALDALAPEKGVGSLFPQAKKGVGSLFLRRIVLADNGSTDDTADAARQRGAAVVHEPRPGYGAACLRALQWIGQQDEPPDVVAFLDADLADDPAALPALLRPIARGEAEIVIGSRARRAEPGALNVAQRFGNRLACVLMAVLTGRRYRDLGPFRAVSRPALQRLGMADRTWGWTVEMQMKAAILNIPTIEVDVPYRRRRAGKSKISGTVRGVAAAGSKIVLTILALWWRRRAIRASAPHPPAPPEANERN